MRSFSFRVRKRYIDDLRNKKKNVEYRRDIQFWRTRVANAFDDVSLKYRVLWLAGEFLPQKVNAIGVFISGKTIVRRRITTISRIRTPGDFSDQGKKDVDTEFCFAFYLGDEIK